MRPRPGASTFASALLFVLPLALPLTLGGSRPVRAAGTAPDTLVVVATAYLEG